LENGVESIFHDFLLVFRLVSDFGLGHLADDSAAFFGVGESVGQICSFDVVEQKVGLFGEIFRRSVAGRVLVAVADALP
jgi:hypothetical protein